MKEFSMGLARRAAAMLLVLAGLFGASQPTSAADGEFVNLSTRGFVGTGDDVGIVGIIIEGGGRQVLIQALGPELANSGVSNPLADPVLTVIQTHEGEPPRTPLASPVELMVNDNWEDSQGQLVSDLWGGSPPLTAGSLSSAVVLTLEPGGYTAKVEGKNGTVGVAIVEVFRIASDGGGTGLAPADQAAFDALFVGKQFGDSNNGLIFLSPGRIREFDGGIAYEGNYDYENTGADTGTLTYTYDLTGNDLAAEKTVIEMTFTSQLAGTFVATYTETGSSPMVTRAPFEFSEATDAMPSFATDSNPGNQTYTVDTAISALTLPEASDGDGTLTYSLTPSVPGLNFNATTRRLTGTPTTASTYNMIYQVRDADGDTDSLTFTITVQEEVSSAPDLVVQAPSVSDASPEPGTSITISATVRNQGAAESTATTLRYYRSTDATISMADTEVGTDAVSALAASSTSNQSISLTAPSTAGTYYYGACVDPVSGESNSQNNCSTAVRVTVAQASDEDVYIRHESLTVGPGWVQYFRFLSGGGGCIDLTGSTVLHNGDPYILISSKWQTRATSSDAWTDIPGMSESSGRLCPYDPLDPGEFRLVAEISIAGQVGKYSSNILGDRFYLASANNLPNGITYANGKLYVVNFSFWTNKKVYAYQPSGRRDSASDFDLGDAGDYAVGIIYGNGKFYVVSPDYDKVYAYTATGQRDSASDFDLDLDASGIAFANDRFYVVGNKAYAYTTAGQRDSASDFDLDLDNGSPAGITYANDRFYVVDRIDEKVYAYTTAGQRDSASDFDLDLDNDDPAGITYANDRFYVVNDAFEAADTVFIYKR